MPVLLSCDGDVFCELNDMQNMDILNIIVAINEKTILFFNFSFI